MRKLVLAAMVAAITSPALAGSLDNPYQRPPLTPPAPELSWGGLYAGVGVTTQQKTVTNTYSEETTSRLCRSSNPSNHNGNKCQISEDDFNHLSETGEFDVVKNPWSRRDLDGPVIYDGGSYYGIWMNGESEVAFSTVDMGDAPTSANKPTDNLLMTTISDVLFPSEDEELAANAFAGYRHLFGNGLAMGVEAGSIGGLEGQVALSQGRWFNYVGYNSDEEFTVGTDRLMGEQGNWFLGGKIASGEKTRAELRIGIKF